MNKKVISVFTLFILFFSNSVSLANTFFNIPIWFEDSDMLAVNAENYNENFLNLESESAILIEQTTRRSII